MNNIHPPVFLTQILSCMHWIQWLPIDKLVQSSIVDGVRSSCSSQWFLSVEILLVGWACEACLSLPPTKTGTTQLGTGDLWPLPGSNLGFIMTWVSHPERGQLLDCPILLSQYTQWDSGVFLWDTKLLKGADDQVRRWGLQKLWVRHGATYGVFLDLTWVLYLYNLSVTSWDKVRPFLDYPICTHSTWCFLWDAKHWRGAYINDQVCALLRIIFYNKLWVRPSHGEPTPWGHERAMVDAW